MDREHRGPQRRSLSVTNWLAVACCLVLLVPICSVILDVLLEPAEKQIRRVRGQCHSNLRQLGMALMIYTDDYDGRFPQGPDWIDVLLPYSKNDSPYHCPAVAGWNSSAYGYAFNSNLFGANNNKIAHPESRITIFDSTSLGRNASDPVTSLPNPPRHEANNVAFADGHVKAKWK